MGKTIEQDDRVEVTITGVFAQYRDVFTDYAGNVHETVRTADRGETVEVPAQEAARLKALGVVADDEADALAQALARAVNPNDVQSGQAPLVPSVSPPGGGVAPIGDLLTGDTGGPDSPPVVPDGSGPVPQPVLAPEGEHRGFDARGKTTVEVIEWLEEGKPSVSEVVAAANGDAEAAKVIIEAEDTVKGGDPRKTVVGPLQKIVDEA